MPISPEAKRVTNNMYRFYGSDSGILFGIPADLRPQIEMVVQTAILLTDKTDYRGIAKGINQGSALVAAHPKNTLPESDIRRALIDTFIVQLEQQYGFNEAKFREICEKINS